MLLNFLFWGLTISVIGKVMIAVAVIMAHSEIAHEHKIDAKVLRSFQKERWLTILGILLIVIGYAMEIYFYDFFTPFLTCDGDDCMAAANTAL